MTKIEVTWIFFRGRAGYRNRMMWQLWKQLMRKLAQLDKWKSRVASNGYLVDNLNDPPANVISCRDWDNNLSSYVHATGPDTTAQLFGFRFSTITHFADISYPCISATTICLHAKSYSDPGIQRKHRAFNPAEHLNLI